MQMPRHCERMSRRERVLESHHLSGDPMNSGRFKAQALVLAAWVLMAASPAESQAPPPIPSKAGVAAGTLKAGSTTVTLAYAYAAGPIESGGGKLYVIELTDQPIPEAAIANEV